MEHIVSAAASGGGGGASEDALLLREAHHRTANEIATAIAAMRLASATPLRRARPALLATAICRLEGFGAAHAILGHRPQGPVALGVELDRLCTALVAARPAPGTGRLDIDCDAGEVDAGLARRVLLVAAELVANALRHAIALCGGTVMVRLRIARARVDLLVADDGPGMAPRAATSGTGLGSSIVAELVANGDGDLEVRSGPTGTAVAVSFPLAPVRIRHARRRASR